MDVLNEYKAGLTKKQERDKNPVVSVYTHEDHSVSVGVCGDPNTKITRNTISELQSRLVRGT